MTHLLVAALALLTLVPHTDVSGPNPQIRFPFADALTAEAPPPDSAVTWTDPQLAPPRPDTAIETWYDCRPPRHDAVCVDGFDTDEVIAAVLRSEPANAEAWRPIVELYFEERHVNRALRVMRCESGGDPSAKNPRSTASGLFQHLGSLWTPRAERAGWAGADVFDPHANIAVAAWLVYEGGGWGHWNPSRHCWG